MEKLLDEIETEKHAEKQENEEPISQRTRSRTKLNEENKERSKKAVAEERSQGQKETSREFDFVNEEIERIYQRISDLDERTDRLRSDMKEEFRKVRDEVLHDQVEYEKRLDEIQNVGDVREKEIEEIKVNQRKISKIVIVNDKKLTTCINTVAAGGTKTDFVRTPNLPLGKIDAPSFDSDGQPVKFVNEIQDYYKAMNLQGYQLKYIINSCLKGTANDWWNSVKDEITSSEDFKVKFLK